jgi:hypothetical protein
MMKKLIQFIVFIYSINIYAANYYCESEYIDKDKKKAYKIKLAVSNSDINIKLTNDGVEIQHCQGKASFNIKDERSIVKSHHIYWDISCNEFQKTDLVFHKKGDLKIYESQSIPDAAFFLKNEQPLKCLTEADKKQFIKSMRKLKN